MKLCPINVYKQHGGTDPYSVQHMFHASREKNPKYPIAMILHGPQSCSAENSVSAGK